MTNSSEILIVGAGICGLMAAQALVQQGRQVTVVDKGRSVGGRLATRRIGPGLADHGAQFFTVRGPAFAAHVAAWDAAGLLFRWANGWSDGSIAGAVVDGHARYAVHGGMNALAKHLAVDIATRGASIRLNVRLTALSVENDGWCAASEDGATFHAPAVVLTAPAPQSLALLTAGGTALLPGQRAALTGIRYAPCLCGLAWVEGRVLTPEPGAIQNHEATIAWLADNRRKGISPAAQVLTLHANPTWSAAHYDDPDELVAPIFLEAIKRLAFGAYEVHELQIKRWRYALPTALYPQPFLRATELPPLYLGGDAFATPRIEGAATSGLAIATALANNEIEIERG